MSAGESTRAQDVFLEKLRGELTGFAPWDDKNKLARTEMLGLCETGVASLERTHFVPGHFTASAFVVCPRFENLLLIHHRKLGLWLQPGGHLEAGDENHVRAAERELVEETGIESYEILEPLFALDVHAIPAYGALPAHRHYDVRVLFRALTESHRRSEEVLGCAWFPLESLTQTQVPLSGDVGTDSSVRSVAARLLALRSTFRA